MVWHARRKDALNRNPILSVLDQSGPAQWQCYGLPGKLCTVTLHVCLWPLTGKYNKLLGWPWLANIYVFRVYTSMYVGDTYVARYLHATGLREIM